MAFKDILRKQRQSGSGIMSSLGTAAGSTALEAIDPRNYLLTKGGFLGSLFPNVKGFKSSSTAPRKTSASLVSSGTPSIGGDKLDIISQNTKISAKNSMILPSMARDMNVMRQNMVKLVKLSGGKAATGADKFFLKASEREKAYESQMQGSKSPTNVKSDVEGSGSGGKSKSGGSSGIMGIFGDMFMAMLPLIALGSLAYFTDPEFATKVNTMVDEKIIQPISDAIMPVIDSLIDVAESAAMAAAALWALSALNVAGDIPGSGRRGGKGRGQKRSPKTFPRVGGIGKFAVRAGVVGVGMAGYEVYAGQKRSEEAMQIMEKKNKGLELSDTEKIKLAEWESEAYGWMKIQEEFEQSMTPPPPKPKMQSQGRSRYKKSQTTPIPVSPQTESETNRAPTPTDGLSLLNSVMDKEGITDENIRSRLIKLAQVESSMNPNARGPVLQSGMHKGDQAHGLLQIMPKTAPEVGFSKEDIRDPEKAATAGVRYFIKNLNRFNGNLDAATVAHHAGPGGAQKWINTGNAGTVDQATGLNTNSYLAKVQGQAELMASSSRVPGSTIASASSQLGTAMMASTNAPPVVINAPTNNVSNSTAGGGGGGMPSVVDTDFMKYLVGKMA
jgi:hypothetical protein